MALYHFNLKQISRNAGQSAIASAAYRAGEKLYSTYYGEYSNYTKKGGVVLAEIHLPPHAPERYRDRQTLWNELEWAEKHKGAQLAHSFEITFMNEFSREENIALGRRFVEEQLVARGMIADICIHNPERQPGAQPNPHMHIMVPIRPLNEDGSWVIKKIKQPLLNQDGNPVLNEKGNPKYVSVSTTGWSSKENLLAMRQAWADMNNELFASKGMEIRLDPRSYEEQGIDLIPTVHEGPNIRAMEEKGIRTALGDLNRLIKWANEILIRARELLTWITKRKVQLQEHIEMLKEQRYEPTLIGYLQCYYDIRNANAEKFQYGTEKAKIYNMQDFSRVINFLTEKNLRTPSDLEKRIAEVKEKLESAMELYEGAADTLKAAKGLIGAYNTYLQMKPVYEEYNRKYFRKDKFKEQHEKELKRFFAARRKLKEAGENPDQFDQSFWNRTAEYQSGLKENAYAQKRELEKELKQLEKVRDCIEIVSMPFGEDAVDHNSLSSEILASKVKTDQEHSKNQGVKSFAPEEKKSIHERLKANKDAVKQNHPNRGQKKKSRGMEL